MTHIFLSPHFDDAAFSCGGTIYQLTQQSESVHIVTVMGGNLPHPLPDTPIIRDLHQRWAAGHDPVAVRREEEQCAAETLGAESSFLNIPDCVYRTDAKGTPCYPTEESLWHDIHPDDPAVTILNLESVEQSSLHIPLGVGSHVDHLILRNWGIKFAEENPSLKVNFYPEYPYTRDDAAIAKALSQCKLGLKQTTTILDEAAMVAKIKAMACYHSQISTFWRDEEHMAAEVRAQFTNKQGSTVEYHYERAEQ